MGGDGGQQLRPYVPEIAVSWLSASPDERYRSVEGTLAFVDISGFTALARRLTRQGAVGSEDLSDILDATFGALLAHARREAGDLVKWGGDAVLLLFTGKDHATRAVRAAVDMRSGSTVGRTRSSAGAVSLRMSVGIHSGWFDFFLVGDPDIHRELVISGPAASRCAEMEALATAGQIMVSAATAALLDPRALGDAIEDRRLVRRRPPDASPHHDPSRLPARLDVAGLLSPPLRDHLLAAAGSSEHRAVGVAFVEFSGTDELLGTDGPEALADALDSVVRNAQDACARHGVTFLESDINRNGGKLTLVAGAPGGGRDVEDRILGVARLVVDRAGVLPLRAGVNRGGVYGGDFGPSFRRTYSIKGDAINLAARVMGKTPIGEVFATAAVLERVRREVDAAPVPPFLVKGINRPVHASSVAAVGDDPDGAMTRNRVADGVANLREPARPGPPAARAVAPRRRGPWCRSPPSRASGSRRSPGRWCRTRRFTWYAAGSAATSGERRPTTPCDGCSAMWPGSAAGRLARSRWPRFAAWSATTARICCRCSRCWRSSSTPPCRTPARPETWTSASEPASWSRSWLRSSTPCSIPVDAAVRGRRRDGRVFSGHCDRAGRGGRHASVARPRDPAEGTRGLQLPEDLAIEEIELAPLDHAQSVALLESWSVERPVSRHLIEAIAIKAGGNPLFMEALLDAARERGTVADLPDSVSAVVAGQIDRLAPRDRTVLRFASVLGDQFAFSSLHEPGERRGRKARAVRPAPARPVRAAGGRHRPLVAVHERRGPRLRVRRAPVPPEAPDAPARRRGPGEDDDRPRRDRRGAGRALLGGRRPGPRVAVRADGR